MRRDRARWDKEREEFEELRRTFEANSENGSGVNLEELSQLQSDRSALNMRVQQLEHQLAEAEHRLAAESEGQNTTELDDLQRRFELAIEDVRELKHRNAELEEALAEIRALGGGEGGSPVMGRDWNATKSRLNALLNQEGEGDEFFDANDRLTVEGAIRITDEIVAQRDQEIEALKEQLAQQATTEAATSAAASSENEQLFDQDATHPARAPAAGHAQSRAPRKTSPGGSRAVCPTCRVGSRSGRNCRKSCAPSKPNAKNWPLNSR